MDGLNAWECSLFRNTGFFLSSELIKEAVLLSQALWGAFPSDGLITAVDPKKIRRKRDPGRCFLKAGWVPFGFDSSKRPRFKAPIPKVYLDWWNWKWHGERGGKLRKELEKQMSDLKKFDISTEAWREYDFGGRVYRIENPQSLYFRDGGSTHRVVVADGTVHCVPAPGSLGCVLRWQNKDVSVPVNF